MRLAFTDQYLRKSLLMKISKCTTISDSSGLSSFTSSRFSCHNRIIGNDDYFEDDQFEEEDDTFEW